MPKPPMPASPQSAPPPRRRAKIRTLLQVCLRMLMLGVGGTVAALVGMILADFYPAPKNAEMPLLERLSQGSQQLWKTAQNLPQILEGQAAPAPPPRVNLPERDRQLLSSDLVQIQTEFQQLGDRTEQLEGQLGIVHSSEPLETRLQSLQATIAASQASAQTATASSPPHPSDPANLSNPSDPSDQVPIMATAQTAAPNTAPNTAPNIAPAQSPAQELRATLPSDVLFTSDQKALRSEGKLLLDSLVIDLRQYPGATIKIGAYVNRQTDAQSDRLQTTQQAKAIEQYLIQKLGKGYKWFTKGYGDSNPLAEGSTPEENQRNRRIEIVVDPG